MESQNIRRKFLKYFKETGHAIIPSSSVVPHEDPTLLFTNAGMNQFKDIFLGESHRDYELAATSQKCIRVGGKHNDLDNVGHTTRHLTFFEMLGNFSFGNYFKQKAITYAWEVSTQVFGFDPSKIWITIFQDDDEAFELWRKIVPETRIVRLGEKDNFWAMGDTGPCGPCSELLYDRGSQYGSAPSPKEDASGERYLEFWNLVFMQFNRDGSGKKTPLPKPCIDTGAGLERVLSLRAHVDNVFSTDILRSLIAQIEEISKRAYNPQDLELAPAYHVIADHIRSLSFAIADGAQPSNVDRGYVLRKLIRRSVRYGRMLGLQDPFLAKVLPRLVSVMGDDFSELKKSQERIAEILTLEEETFLRTLKRGGAILGNIIQEAKTRPLKDISGQEAFKLKDTYGLPVEEILLIAKDTGLTVNLEAYELLEEEAKELSKAARTSQSKEVKDSIYTDFLKSHSPSLFVGYDHLSTTSTIQGILVDGAFAESLEEGQEGILLLDKTPFYAEKGGQVGDQGTISSSAASFSVIDCKNPHAGIIAHTGKCLSGILSVGQRVESCVIEERRQQIQNNHTATHLLHFALQQVVGAHIKQAGSLVEESRLRFDFNHHKPLSPSELETIEERVNAHIRQDTPVKTYELSYEEAQKKAEIKQFFGDKYGSKVRVVDIEESKELCGGTHTLRTGTIGYFRIAKEGSIAAGVRRIEAVTGKEAEAFVKKREEDLLQKMHLLSEEKKKLEQQIKALKKSNLKTLATELEQQAVHVGPIRYLGCIPLVEAEEVAVLMEELAQKMPISSIIALGVRSEERCQLVVKVSKDISKNEKLAAHVLIKEISTLIQGSGGGRADIAQAGGKDPKGLEAALEKIRTILSLTYVK